MLRRKAYDALLDWKGRKDHKCLLVKGQRQVGKTYLLRSFGERNYERVAYLDFSRSNLAASLFDGDIDRADALANMISVYDGKGPMVPGSTLIILDEIQECPRARTALKTFAEDGRYDVVASGSLLDAADRDRPVFIPVGYEEQLVMRSLDFEEFLWAMGMPEEAVSEVRGCIHGRRPIPEVYMRRFGDLFVSYMLVGGMPEAVAKFAETGSYDDVHAILERIVASGKSDIGKYGGRDRVKIEACFESIPYQLAQSNKKFMYARIGKRLSDDDGVPPASNSDAGRSRKAHREYGDSLDWIRKAGMGNYCHALYSPRMPLEYNSDPGHFKVYMSDTGLLLSMYGVATRRAVLSRNTSCQAGAITENEVAECIVKAGYRLYYISRSRGPEMMEIDFVIEIGDEVLALEVKSGKTREAPSIRKVQAVFPSVTRRAMFENSNVSVDGEGIEHYPLFAAAFIDELEEGAESPITVRRLDSTA